MPKNSPAEGNLSLPFTFGANFLRDHAGHIISDTRLHEKGDKRRTIGLHYQAAKAIAEYIEKAGLIAGPLFRPRLNSRSRKLGTSAMSP